MMSNKNGSARSAALLTVPVTLVSLPGCSAPVDIDVEQGNAFGLHMAHVDAQTLEKSLSPPSRLSESDKLDQASFYEKGVYYVRVSEGQQKMGNQRVRASLKLLTVYLAKNWSGVPASIYKPFSGSISKGIAPDWSRDQTLKALSWSTLKLVDSGLDPLPGDNSPPSLAGGTHVIIPERPSSEWSRDFWETENLNNRKPLAI